MKYRIQYSVIKNFSAYPQTLKHDRLCDQMPDDPCVNRTELPLPNINFYYVPKLRYL